MTNPSNGRTQDLWCFMVEQGGFWTAAELSHALGLKGIRIDGMLYQMAQRGFVIRRQRPDRLNGFRFGVTLHCKPPSGLTLAEIAKAVARLQARAASTEEAAPYVPRTTWAEAATAAATERTTA